MIFEEDYIFTLDLSENHSVHVFNANNGNKICTLSTGKEPVFDMCIGRLGRKGDLSNRFSKEEFG